MNMFDFIDKLRKKSPATKNAIALTVSALITSIIFFIWISTFWLSPNSNKSEKFSISDIASPVASIKENVADIYSSFAKFLDIGRKEETEEI